VDDHGMDAIGIFVAIDRGLNAILAELFEPPFSRKGPKLIVADQTAVTQKR
jgi:hypothetical protein